MLADLFIYSPLMLNSVFVFANYQSVEKGEHIPNEYLQYRIH